MKQYMDTPYFVSESGGIFRDGKELKFYILKKKGKPTYKTVKINKTTMYVHRIVAMTYLPNPNNLPEVDHRDTNKLNNHYTNLEWSTDRENKDHAIENGLYPRGEEHTNILSTEQVIWIRQNYKKGDKELGRAPLSRKFNVSKGCIAGIIKNRTWKHLIPNQPS
jgi:hypothetical protein